jgi:hypothetical protein
MILSLFSLKILLTTKSDRGSSKHSPLIYSQDHREENLFFITDFLLLDLTFFKEANYLIAYELLDFN